MEKCVLKHNSITKLHILFNIAKSAFLDPEGSLSATTVVLLLVVVLVVTRFRKMPKALLICNVKLRNFAYTFVTSFPTDLPS